MLNPFDLPRDLPPGQNNAAAYEQWRNAKLADYPARAEDLLVEVRDALSLSPAERAKILDLSAKTNMALFHDGKGRLSDRSAFRKFAAEFGLVHLSPHLLADPDGIASITPTSRDEIKGEYIPYTTRPLNWHTDGYYATDAASTIKGFALYCVRAAGSGGMSALIDPEIAYIRLRDQNPDHIAAFSRPDAMTIPANIQNGVEIRAETTGPVFSQDARGRLVMRYTARTVSIVWPDDAEMTAARAALDEVLAGDAAFRYAMKSGDGLLCNNVLHKRSAFDDPDRLLYRGRFLDRLSEPLIDTPADTPTDTE